MEEAVGAFVRVVRILHDGWRVSRRRIDKIAGNAVRAALAAAAPAAMPTGGAVIVAVIVAIVAVDEVSCRRAVFGLLAAHDLRVLAASDGERQTSGRSHQRKDRSTHVILPPGKRTDIDCELGRLTWVGIAVGVRRPRMYIGGISGRSCRIRRRTTIVMAGLIHQPCRFGIIGINSHCCERSEPYGHGFAP
jgi:hypothetical protein